MQEEVENKTVNLAISTTKLTGSTLIKAFQMYLKHRANAKATKHGKMTVGELLAQGKGAQQMDVADTSIRDFERVLKKYGVDYAVRKDATQEPPRYMVFFKARDADVLTAAFKEYSAELNNKEKRPSVRKLLKKLIDKVRSSPDRTREKHQERAR